MPADGIYLSNDRFQQLQGDLFEQDARGLVADTWERTATSVAPSMVSDAQDRASAAAEQQRQQAEAAQAAQRQAAADQFEATATAALPQMAQDAGADPALVAHLGGAPAPPVSPQDANLSTPAVPPLDTASDLNAAPAVTPTSPVTAPLTPSPTAPVTAPLSNPMSMQQPIAPSQPATATTAELSGGGAGSGRVTPQAQSILAGSSDVGSWLGDQGVKALQSVLVTEGGMNGARGDNGKSAGPLQFYEGGQLANFAQQHNMTLDQAKAYVEANPLEAVRWAVGTPDAPGYLGSAILAGQKAGLQGADLATYAQQHGQVSVSPERAGANYNALFGGGQNPIQAAGNAVTSAVQDPQSILAKAAPFLGQSYVWGGKSPQTGFDCSGLAGYLTTGQPESTTTLYGKSAGVSPDQAVPGDLVFWNMNSSDPHLQHVGVYLGNGQIVQSGGNQAAVNIGSVNQDIGSAPEFRRVGGGQPSSDAVPAQATAAPPGAPSPADLAGQTAAATSMNPMDRLSQIGQTISSAITTGLQNIFGTSDQPTGAGQAAQTAGGAVQDFAMNGPLGAARSAAQGATGYVLGGQARADLAGAIAGEADTAPLGPLIPAPVQSAALNAAAGFVSQPSPVESMQTLSDLQQKYAPGKVLPVDPAVMTPTDAAAYSNARVAVAGLLAEPGATFDKYGVAIDQAPAATVSAGHLPSPVETPTLGLNERPPDLWNTPEATAPLGTQPAGINQPSAENVDFLQAMLDRAKARGVGTDSLQGAQQGIDDMRTVATPRAPSPESQLLADMGHPEGAATAETTNGVPSLGLTKPTADDATAATPPPSTGAVPPTVAGVPPTLPAPPPIPPAVPVAATPPVPPPIPGTASWSDVVKAFHTANVVSGLTTLTHVVVNSVVSPVWSFGTRGAADLAGGHFDRAAGSGIGMAAGLADSGRALAQAFSDHFSNPEAVFNKTLPTGLNNDVAKTFLRLQAVPTALHAMGQSFAQNAITKMEIGRLAGEEATSAGLSGQAWTNYISNAINNPATAIAQQAEATAKRAALRGDLGTIGSAFSKAVSGVPYVGNALFPVVKIGTNVLTQGIEKSPVGLLGTGYDVARAALGKSGPYAQGFAGNGIVAPLQERLTNNLAGTALTAWLASKALDGAVTGDGPSDPAQKAELMAQGWQPDSVYVPGRGYVDFHVLGPLSYPLSLAGAYGDAVKYGGPKGGTTSDPQFIAESMFQQTMKYMEDATGMRTIGQLYDIFHSSGSAMSAAAKTGALMASSTLGGFVPFSGLDRSLAIASDPNARKPLAQAGDFGSLFAQDLSAGLPVAREQNVPVMQNLWGQPNANNQQGLGIFSPRTGTGTPDPTVKLLMDAGVKFPALPAQVAVSSKYAIDLTPEEKQQFQALRGQLVQQMLQGVADDPTFASAPIEKRQQLLQKVFAQADKDAGRMLVTQIPDDQLVERALANQAQRVPVAVASP